MTGNRATSLLRGSSPRWLRHGHGLASARHKRPRSELSPLIVTTITAGRPGVHILANDCTPLWSRLELCFNTDVGVSVVGVCVDGLQTGLRTVRAIPEPEVGSRLVRGRVSPGAQQQALSF